MSYEVKFYCNFRGDNPIEDFINLQDRPTQAKFLRLITLLINYGPQLHLPYSRKLNSHLFELRSHGDTKIRLIYTVINHQFIVLHAFKKKSQKTPSKEIVLAENRRLTLR